MSDRTIDILTDSPEVSVDFIIGDTNDLQTVSLQKGSSFSILLLFFRFKMLRAIQFYDQIGFCTVKVNNILSYNLLPDKPNRVSS